MKRLLSLLLPILSVAFIALANSPSVEKPKFHATLIERPIQLSGRLDDPLWRLAQPVELPYEIQPAENTPASQKTLAYALYDKENLYLGFRCFDTNPALIRANLSDRDKAGADDYVIVAIDTYGDTQRAYELAVNPYGIQTDLMRTLTSEDASFDMIWESAASINEDGWTAEMSIPFKSLRFPVQNIQEWSIVIIRNIPRESRVQTSWTAVDRNIPNLMSQGGILKGLKNIQPGGSVEVLPYVLGQQAGTLATISDPSSRFEYGAIQGRLGTGLRYSPGSALSVDAVLNPDFSQIESDADQISVNTTFALFYNERRPFFLEGLELLQTPMYYSRSINNPLAAGRIVGKSGGLSYMAMSAYDRNTVFVVPGEEESSTIPSAMKSVANIGRLRYDLGDEAYVGGMLFTRNFPDGHNYLVGFDWAYKFWENWYFSGEGFLTHTRERNDSALFQSDRPLGGTGITAGFDGERYGGRGIHVVLSRSGREYSFDVVYNDFSPTYQTYNGFFTQTDYRQFYVAHTYSLYPNSPVFDKMQFQLSGNLRYNYAGMLKEEVVQPSVSLTMKGQTTLYASYLLVNDEHFQGVELRKIQRTLLSVISKPIDLISLAFDAQFGRFIYRSASPIVGTGHQLDATITLKPTSRLKLDLTYARARLSEVEGGSVFFDGYVIRGVGVYQFTPEFFFRAIVQYNSFSENLYLYPLVSYKLNAFTTFYAGLTNDYLDYGTPTGFKTTTRQFFVKLQYLFRS